MWKCKREIGKDEATKERWRDRGDNVRNCEDGEAQREEKKQRKEKGPQEHIAL